MTDIIRAEDALKLVRGDLRRLAEATAWVLDRIYIFTAPASTDAAGPAVVAQAPSDAPLRVTVRFFSATAGDTVYLNTGASGANSTQGYRLRSGTDGAEQVFVLPPAGELWAIMSVSTAAAVSVKVEVPYDGRSR